MYNRHDEQVEMNSYIISGGGLRLQCVTNRCCYDNTAIHNEPVAVGSLHYHRCSLHLLHADAVSYATTATAVAVGGTWIN